jgi:hypothetical protein
VRLFQVLGPHVGRAWSVLRHSDREPAGGTLPVTRHPGPSADRDVGKGSVTLAGGLAAARAKGRCAVTSTPRRSPDTGAAGQAGAQSLSTDGMIEALRSTTSRLARRIPREATARHGDEADQGTVLASQ